MIRIIFIIYSLFYLIPSEVGDLVRGCKTLSHELKTGKRELSSEVELPPQDLEQSGVPNTLIEPNIRPPPLVIIP